MVGTLKVFFFAVVVSIALDASFGFLRPYGGTPRSRSTGIVEAKRITLDSSAVKYEDKIRSLLVADQEGTVDNVEEVFVLMLKNGHNPSLNTTVEVLTAVGSSIPSRAAALFDRLRVYEAPVVDNVEVYNMLLRSWIRSGDDCLDYVLDLIKRMKYNGITLNRETYKELLCINSTIDRTSSRPLALLFFEEMEDQGYTPEIDDYRTLLASLTSYPPERSVARLQDSYLRKMIDKSASEVGVMDFMNVIMAWEKQGTIDTTERIHSLICEMTKLSIAIPGSIRLSYIKACCKSLKAIKDVSLSASLSRLKDALDSLHILLDSKLIHEAQVSAEAILEVGYRNDCIDYEKMIELVSRMISCGVLPSIKTWTYLIKTLESFDNHAQAYEKLETLRQVLRENYLYGTVLSDISVMRSIMNILVASGAIDDANTLINEIQSSKESMSDDSSFLFMAYKTLVQLLLRDGNYTIETCSWHQLMCNHAQSADDVAECVYLMSEIVKDLNITISIHHYESLFRALEKYPITQHLDKLDILFKRFLGLYSLSNEYSTVPSALITVMSVFSSVSSKTWHAKTRELYNLLKEQYGNRVTIVHPTESIFL